MKTGHSLAAFVVPPLCTLAYRTLSTLLKTGLEQGTCVGVYF